MATTGKREFNTVQHSDFTHRAESGRSQVGTLCDRTANISPDFEKRLDALVTKVKEEDLVALAESYLKDGKWEELLAKPADEITEEEYKTLALIYLNMSDEDAERFINKCLYVKPKAILENGYPVGMTSQCTTILSLLETYTKEQCSDKVATLLNSLPGSIREEIINKGGTEQESRW